MFSKRKPTTKMAVIGNIEKTGSFQVRFLANKQKKHDDLAANLKRNFRYIQQRYDMLL